MWNDDRTHNEQIGSCLVPLKSLCIDFEVAKKFELTHSGRNAGYVYLRALWYPLGTKIVETVQKKPERERRIVEH